MFHSSTAVNPMTDAEDGREFSYSEFEMTVGIVGVFLVWLSDPIL